MNYLTVKVDDRESFAQFLKLLLKDFEENGADWENNRLELFLEAMHAYTVDLPGHYKNVHPEHDADIPNWQRFADILKGAVVYE